jgi:hypothetical protein
MEGYDNIVKNEYKTDNHSIGNTKMFRIEGEVTKKIGRPVLVPNAYCDVTIDGKEYVKGIVNHKNEPLEFLIDKEDEENVKSRHWYAVKSGNYIVTNVTTNSSVKQLQLHNFVMKKFTFERKGHIETIHHINGNGLDNRKENLRNIITQTVIPERLEDQATRMGRPAIPITYRDEVINDKLCVIGTLISKDTQVEFIIDKDDEEKVKNRQWYAGTGGKYIASHINIGDDRKHMYLHNFIMNKFTFDGKGQKETVDHINRNGLDNRKDNLRFLSQSMQNVNQKKRARTAVLPEGIPELPRHIWYAKANGLHGDRFVVEIKTEKIIKKTTSSKSVSIQEKFAQALKIRDEVYEQFPYLKQNVEENS